MHPHQALLGREAKAPFSLEFYTADHLLRYPGRSRIAGDHHGHAGLQSFQAALAGILRTLERDFVEVLANDERGLQLVHVRAERADGARHAWRVAWLFRFRDGKLCESAAVVDDQDALDRFLDG